MTFLQNGSAVDSRVVIDIAGTALRDEAAQRHRDGSGSIASPGACGWLLVAVQVLLPLVLFSSALHADVSTTTFTVPQGRKFIILHVRQAHSYLSPVSGGAPCSLWACPPVTVSYFAQRAIRQRLRLGSHLWPA
jgi:hypothetical protein